MELQDSTLGVLPPPAQTYAMLAYQSYLVAGETLVNQPVCSATIRQYMKIAVNHCFPSCNRDVRIFPDENEPSYKWKPLPDFEQQLEDIKKWESLPN